VAILAPVLISLALVIRFCSETRGRDLRDLETDVELSAVPEGKASGL
jgi:hypothetical protein